MTPTPIVNRICSGLLICLCSLLVRSQEPVLVLPTGHTSVVGKVYYSPTGSLIASVSWDNTAKIWSAAGRLLFDLKGHTGTVTAGAFSPDAKRFYTCAMDSTVCAWDLQTGALIFRKTFSEDWLTDLALSPDGKTLLVGGWDGRLNWLSPMTGKTIRSVSLRSSVIKLSYSPDGAWISVIGKDSSIRLLPSAGIENARLKSRFKFQQAVPTVALFRPGSGEIFMGWSGHGPALYDLKTGKIKMLGARSLSAAAWSFDGRTLCAGDDSGELAVWVMPFTAAARSLGSMNTKIQAIAFVPASPLLYCAGLNGRVSLANIVSGQLEKTWQAHGDWINDIAVSPATSEVVTASSDQTLALWRYDKNDLRRMSGHSAAVTGIALDSSGQRLTMLSEDSLIRTFDLTTGSIVTSLRSPGSHLNTLHISPRGQMLLSGLDSTAWLNDSLSGGAWRPLRGASDWIQTSGFSNTGGYVATGSWDGSLCVYACPSGKKLFRTPVTDAVPGTITFSSGDSLLAVGYWNGAISVYHLPDGARLCSFEGHTGKVRSLSFDRYNHTLLSSAWDSTVRIWNVKGHAALRTFKEPDAVNQALYLPGDSLVLLASMDKTIKCLDWRSASPRYRCVGPAMPVVSMLYDSVTNRITGLSEENICYVWDAADGRVVGHHSLGDGHERSAVSGAKLMAIATDDNRFTLFRKGLDSALYSGYAIDSAEYLITSTNNRYDGTPAARGLVYYRCNQEIVDLGQLKNLNWESGLAIKRMRNEPMTYTASGAAGVICNYTPYVSVPVRIKDNYNFHITIRDGGLAGYRLKLNGKPVFSRDLIKTAGQAVEVSVPADSITPFISSAGPNEITAEAFTAGGVLSARGNGTFAAPLRRNVHAPDIYIISVGVSNYKSPELHLAFPSLDAGRFSMAVSNAAGKLFNTDNREHVHSFLFNQSPESWRPVSKRAVQELLDSLSGVTTPDDIVLFFFAGHGVLQDGDRDFYLLTPEASAFSIRGVENQVAVSTRELIDWSRKLKAGKQILILDACNSGKAVGNLQDLIRSRDVPEDQLRALENLRDKTGLYILSAASAGQAAYETPEYGDGFLTYALLAGLRQGTGLRDNKFVDLNRWFNDAADRVKMMARRNGKQQEPQLIGGPSFDLGIMDSSLAALIPLAAEKSIIGRSQFIEDEDLLTDELDVSGMADRYLYSLSSGEKNSGFVFISDSRRAGIYLVRGRYKITGNRLSINAFLLKGGREKIAVQQMEGSLSDQEQLIQRCLDALVRSINR